MGRVGTRDGDPAGRWVTELGHSLTLLELPTSHRGLHGCSPDTSSHVCSVPTPLRDRANARTDFILNG